MMTPIKLLSIGLIAIAMLTMSAEAREKQRVIIRVPSYMGNSAIAVRSYKLPLEPDGRWIIWDGIPIWFGPSVRGWPGHICDWGDNVQIC
jgi:hypothetical protein